MMLWSKCPVVFAPNGFGFAIALLRTSCRLSHRKNNFLNAPASAQETFLHQAPHFQYLRRELEIMSGGDLDILTFCELELMIPPLHR